MKNLLTREEILATNMGALNENVYKMGDIYKVKTVIDVPKSLINAFVSKAKKEHDVDPREDWSDKDLAELFVKYIMSTYVNIESLPVDAIIGEQELEEPATLQAVIIKPTVTEIEVEKPIVQPVQDQELAEVETKIANIPASVEIQQS